MLFVNKSPDNSGAFEDLSNRIRNSCSVEELASVLPRTNPTPAQMFQTLEIIMLSNLPRESKPEYLTVLGTYIDRSCRKIPGADEPEPALMGMMAAYQDAGKMIKFCQEGLNTIITNSRGTDEVSAEDINSYQFAKLQDTLRLMLRLIFRLMRCPDWQRHCLRCHL